MAEGTITGTFLRCLGFVAIVASASADDLYLNSYISPKSFIDDDQPSELLTDLTSGPREIQTESKTLTSPSETTRVERSPDPILSRTSGIVKNVAEPFDSNDVELSGKMAYIQPSKTLRASGEAQGAPQARSISLLEPLEIRPTATMIRNFASQSPEKPRQANNPDIQDIITGIVKLLNGNVNVQANTGPVRPVRPVSTRINNRGPPRISDVPALPPDFDVPISPPLGQPLPSVSPTKMPTPYPFELPPKKEPFQRPGYRPVTIPSWTRPPNRRPGPPRRPIPPYKPIPNHNPSQNVSSTSEKPIEDVFNLDFGTETVRDNETTTENPVTEISEKDKQDLLEFEKNKEKSSSKMEKHTKTEYSTSIEPTTETTPEIQPTILNSTEVANSTEVTPKLNETTPTLESSILEVSSTLKDLSTRVSPTESLPPVSSSEISSSVPPPTPANSEIPYYSYRPRPGIVLDDTEYKPGGIHRQPILTARPPVGQLGDIFDITVSAIQGPGGSSSQGKPYIIPVDIDHVNGDVITSPVGDQGFVSIDGKRTYLNLFGEATPSQEIKPAATTSLPIAGTAYAVTEVEKETNDIIKTTRRPGYVRRPSQPPVRIDTCIVGDDSTCDGTQHEICRTEAGVSACHCRPGHARRKHRDPCRKVVSVLVSLRVDRLYDRRIIWVKDLTDRSSESYQQLSFETERAMDSAMSMTPFSDEFLGAKVNGIYRGDRSAGQAGVFVNLTLQLEENVDTSRPAIRADIQRHLLGVIQRRSNNVGNSALWVDSPPGSVSSLQDLDECSSPELHDCHALATCINLFGGFRCECGDGLRDPWSDSKYRAGRHCEQCSPQFCNNRGECKYQNGQEACVCTGNYYGTQCEVDGEVLGVAIGASVAAVVIIGLTLVCLVMWSRRWNREQKAAVGSPVFGYMATAGNTIKTPMVGSPPYQVSMEDRLRWAQIADAMAQSNHYGPEPVPVPTRPSSAIFGYPNLSMAGTLQRGTMHGTLPPVPLPRLNLQAQFGGRMPHGMRPLDNSSSSEEEDRTDLLGRNFQVPRPKSRSNASVANQSGIYYDVDYEPNEIYKPGGIPMSTYTVGRASYYRN